MKNALLVFVLSLFGLAACSTMGPGRLHPAKPVPEMVLVTYHVKPGKEGELQAVLAQAWKIYRAEHLVFAEPHVIVRGAEDGDKVRFVEVFTWVSHEASEHAPDSVYAVWGREQSLCEARGGHTGIEGGEVEFVVPARK